MTETHHQHHWYSVAATMVVYLYFQASTVAQQQTTQPLQQSTSDKRSMIDQLANRNVPPKLFDVDGRPTPLFAPKFDWREQARVRAALAKLHKDRTVQLWEQLVHNTEDSRYSLTVAEDGEWAVNRTIGDFCAALAWSQLVGVFEQHLEETNDPLKPGQIYVAIEITPTSLGKWRTERKFKALYELQIEVCERALKSLPTAKGASMQKKSEMADLIQAEIQMLKKTRRPIIRESNILGLDTYTAEMAKAMAERIQQAK